MNKILRKSQAGQSQLALAVLVIAVTSVIVLIVNPNITGFFIGVTNETIVEEVVSIDVWGNTSINISEQFPIRALLSLDNGTALSGKEIKFYLNDIFLDSKTTDTGGYATIDMNSTYGTDIIKAVFEGDPSLFLNPSETIKEIEIKNVSEIPSTGFPALNQTLLTVKADKISYIQNETVNVFGEILVNGTRSENDIDLNLLFNKTPLYITKIKAMNGSYSYSFLANFTQEGEYSLKTFAENLTNSTSFYYSFTISENVTNITTENITIQNITQTNITLSIDASVSVENVTNTSLKSVTITGNIYANGSRVVSNVSIAVKDPKGKIIFQDWKITDGNFLFNFTFLPKLSGTYTVEITADTDYGSTSKTLTFEILKHKVVKAKIKQPKWNYALGEKIKFEIDAIDEDGLLYPNATIQVFVTDPEGNVTEVNFTEDDIEDGKYWVELDTEREFRPGIHKLKVRLTYISPNPGEVVVEEEITFAVGLININTNKSIYLPGENATAIVGVLNEQGKRVNDATLILTITSPSGKTEVHSTLNGLVQNNGDGTYTSYYITSEVGNYTILVHTEAENVSADYTTYFKVSSFVEFDIERKQSTLVDILGQEKVAIKFKPSISAENITIIEKIPKDFLEITAYDGKVERKQNETWIIWKFDKLSGGEEKTLTYQFTAPDVKPIIYLIGPADVYYNNSFSFNEVRGWTVMVADVNFYFFGWSIYDNQDNKTVVNPEALCAGGNYSIRTAVFDPALDENSPTQNWFLQVFDQGVFYNLDYGGWTLRGGETNPHSFAGLGITVGCAAGGADICEWGPNTMWNISIDNSVNPGNYRFRIYPEQRPTGPKFDTNIHPITVLNCTDVNIFSPVTVFSPTGEKNKVIKGHTAIVVLPLANYESTVISDINATLQLFDGTTELGWFIEEGNNITIGTLPGSPSRPILSNTTKQWHVQIPDDVDGSKTYTARVTVDYPTGQKVLERTFTVYVIETVATDVVIFTSTPRMISSASTDRINRTISVCNFGDYNLDVNLTDYFSLNSYVDADPAASSSATGIAKWNNKAVNTSSCFTTKAVYQPSTDSGEEQFIAEAVWKDPVTGLTKTLTKTHTTLTMMITAKVHGSAFPSFNVTSIPHNSSNVSVGLIFTNDGAFATQVFYIDLFIPPGFYNPRSFSRTPDTGYPIGSSQEGYTVRWSVYGAGGTVCTATATVGTTYCPINFLVDVNSTPTFAPGGKAFTVTTIGFGATKVAGKNPKAYLYSIDQQVIVVNSTFMKTSRYYNSTATTYTSGFPSSFACGVFNTSLQVWNKGNVPFTNANITENKENITVTHGDLIFQNAWSSPAATATIDGARKVNWDGGINFDVFGRDAGTKIYNYTINVTYQTNGTFRFQGIPLNATAGYRFQDENYTLSASCGAALSVSTPTNNTPVTVGYTTFNVSSTITNDGPGSATFVVSAVNYTSDFNSKVKNATGSYSDFNYPGTIGPTSSYTSTWIIDPGVGQGTYKFCINATATENSTNVVSCADITIEGVGAFVTLSNPLTTSNETGTSSGSWGFNWTFNVTANANTNTNVRAWVSKDGGTTWTQIGGQQNHPGDSVTRNFTWSWDPSCANIPAGGGGSTLKFNNTATSDSTSTTFTQTTNKVIWEYESGQGLPVNRSGSQTTLYSFQARDLNGTNLTSFVTKFYVTRSNDSTDFYTTSSYEVTTNDTGYANFYFNPGCGATKFGVGEQQWKIRVNGSETNCYTQNDSYSLIPRNLSVQGDIPLSISKPKIHSESGGQNFTQEETVSFLGSTTDDCGDSLTISTSNIAYYANHSTGASFNCTANDLIGANAYSCEMPTDINTNKGAYNVTMFANTTDHYANRTVKSGVSPDFSLFYIEPVFKLQKPNATSDLNTTTDGWGRKNWNFSVSASSGDPDAILNVTVWTNKGSPTFTESCAQSTCANQTPVICINCINSLKYWFRNFTASDRTGGADTTWFFKYEMNTTPTATASTSGSIVLEEDDTNLTYGDSGNNSNPGVNASNSVNFTVRVADVDANTFSLSPAATVTFYLNHSAYGAGGKVMGSASTNSTGYATLNFSTACNAGFQTGQQNWFGAINDTETDYKRNTTNTTEPSSLLFTTLSLGGCTAQVSIIDGSGRVPSQAILYRNFTVNATVTSLAEQSLNVNVTLQLPGGWTKMNNTPENLGNVQTTDNIRVSWTVNATSYGQHNVTVNASGGVSPSGTTNDTEISSKFIVYNASTAATPDIATNSTNVLTQVNQINVTLGQSFDNGTTEALIKPGGNLAAAWICDVGHYRLANITAYWEADGVQYADNSTKARVFVYNGTSYINILHSYPVPANATRTEVAILQDQIQSNETGYCNIKIENVGSNDLWVDYLQLTRYYNNTVVIQDINASIGNTPITGIETDEKLVNVTVKVANSNTSNAVTVDVGLDIRNDTASVNSSIQAGLSLSPNSNILVNFTNINTSTWLVGNYSMIANVTGTLVPLTTRTEPFVFRNISLSTDSTNYICNQTTEEFKVIITHPFIDDIQYNVSLQVPSGWSRSPAYYLVNASGISNHTALFNLTAGTAAAENVTINATVNYTYPTAKARTASRGMEEGNSLPIIEIIRETPKTIASDKVFESQISAHNKGCGSTSGNTIVQEQLSTGWTPANPGIKTNEFTNDAEVSDKDVDLVSSSTDLENNRLTWTLGAIGVNKYAVLTYQIKSLTATASEGSFRFNTTWNRGNLTESTAYAVQTSNFSSESHLEFDLDAVQQSAFPWPESRSVRVNNSYNLSLKATNIGDLTTTTNQWNATLTMPSTCDVIQVFNSGSFNSTNRKIAWQVPSLASRASTLLNFTLNCTTVSQHKLTAEAIYDNRSTTGFLNSTSIGCSGGSCSGKQSFTFTKPAGARYEQMQQIDFNIFYDWTGQNVTLAEGFVNISDDTNKERIAWQNYSLSSDSSTIWSNYSIDTSDQKNFIASSRDIGVRTKAFATFGENANVTVQQLNYTWRTGKNFQEPQDLFIKAKVYDYIGLLSNATLAINGTQKTTGGWGENFTFSVEVRDRFGRDATVNAWHKTTAAADYTLISSFTCVSCSTKTTANFTYDYVAGNITTWTFKFNATNADGASTLDGSTYTVEKDDVNVDRIQPAADVNVTRNETTVFSVRVFDRDNNTYPNGTGAVTGKNFISISGTDVFETTPPTLTSDNGFLNRSLATSDWCNAQTGIGFLGKHGWKGGTETTEATVKDNITSPVNFTLVGANKNKLVSPDGTANFTRGVTITFAGTVNDACNNNNTLTATKNFKMFQINSSGQESFQSNCTVTAGDSCTIATTSSFPLGYYNVSTSSNKTDYHNELIQNNSFFFLRTVPLLEDAKRIPPDALSPWGKSPFNFTVNITDADNDTVTVTLLINNTSSSYRIENTTTCTNCNNFFFFTTKNFTNTSITGNKWFFRFNASDTAGTTNQTSDFTFNVTTDNISFSDFGWNNTDINRSDALPNNIINITTTITDEVLQQNVLNPSTPNISLAEIRFFVNNGTADVEDETEEFLNGTTNFYRQFNPACNYAAGSQNVVINVSNSQPYTTNTTAGNDVLRLNIIGQLTATYISPTGAQEFERGTNIIFQGNVTDECNNNVTAADVVFQLRGPTANETCGPVTNATGFIYSCTFDTTGKDVGTYNITMVANKTFNLNGTDTENLAVKIKSTPSLKGTAIDIDADGWGVPRNFSVNVTDNTGDEVTVRLWEKSPGGSFVQIDGTKTCVSCSNTSISFARGYACADVSTTTWAFKFNSTDTEGNVDETTVAGGDYLADDVFTVEKDNVRIDFIDGNESIVTLNNRTRFQLRVFNIDNNTFDLLETATATFNVTKAGKGSANATAGTNTTNSTGFVEFNFQPDQTYQVKKQDWYGYTDTQSCYKFNESSIFNVTTLTNAPRLDNETIDIRSDGWGIQRNFSVMVFDQNNTANVSLWRATALGGSYVFMNSSTYTDINSFQRIDFVQAFNPSLINTWFFKFNASNEVGNTNTTANVAANNFTLEKDDVLLTAITGNNTIANRSQNQLDRLIFRFRDENGTFLSNFPTKFSVTSDKVTFFTDKRFQVIANSTGYANFDFNATCSGEFTGAPKFAVGEQFWKVAVNDSELTAYSQNDSSTLFLRNLSLQGDILLTFTKPDGSANFTQEDTINFLGSTTDDCNDALTLTPATDIRYFANSTANPDVQCTGTTRVGANAYTCDLKTDITTTKGTYNTTMIANATNHYTNSSVNSNAGDKTLQFFLKSVFKLDQENGTSDLGTTTDGWGRKNWNFTVRASSGDPDEILNVTVFNNKGSPTFAESCSGATCVNQTPVICINCLNSTKYWYRNFTASDLTGGTDTTWFFKFEMNTTPIATVSTTGSIVLEEDDTNLTYGGFGNNSNPDVGAANSVNFTVRVADLDANTFNLSPAATVTFYLNHSTAYPNGKVMGSGTTNSTGYATLNFSTACGQGFQSGQQNWFGAINSTEADYKQNTTNTTQPSSLLWTTLSLTGCQATVDVVDVFVPGQLPIDRNFTVNATITSLVDTSLNVNVTLQLPSDWTKMNNTPENLGTVLTTDLKRVSWTINATSYGQYNVTVNASGGVTGGGTSDDTKISDKFIVYNASLRAVPNVATNSTNVQTEVSQFNVTLGQSSDNGTIEALLKPGGSLTAGWLCDVGDYRLSNLTAIWEADGIQFADNSTKARVLTYNGTSFIDILHSYPVPANATRTEVAILHDQIQSNETGYCNIKIENVGNRDLWVDFLQLTRYYNNTVVIQDVNASIGGTPVIGTETDEKLVNVTVKVANSNTSNTVTVDVGLDIRNDTASVNSSIQAGLSLPANSNILVNFTNINTSTWLVGNYSMIANVTGSLVSLTTRTEPFIFRNISLDTKSTKYICDQTTETFDVTVVHPFADSIQYNVSLKVPSSWSYSPSFILVNVSEPKNYTASFNVTSGTTNQTAMVNATANYTYPTAKSRSANRSIEENTNIPILEVVRETPVSVANSTEFVSSIAVHNKGCAPATSVNFIEKVSSGWTPFSPTMDGATKGTADIPKSEVRYDSSDFGTIDVRDYRILAYKLFPPTGLLDTGTLRFNLTWGSRDNFEEKAFEVKTIRYVREPHLEFDLIALGSFKARSAEPSKNQSYNFTVTNIGDYNVTNRTWNVTLSIPSSCTVFNHTATFNSSSGKLMWQLDELEAGKESILALGMNCTDSKRHILQVETINNSISLTNFTNASSISCSGASCSSTQNFTFTKPSDPRYEKLTQINFNVSYSWTGQNLTIADGRAEVDDDVGKKRLAWQNYSFVDAVNSAVANYSLTTDEQEQFVQATRGITVTSQVHSTANANGNVTVQNLDYTWQTGKSFNDSQPLFLDIKNFIFIPDAPVLTAPLNDSLQASEPVVLSWREPANANLKPADTTISYLVFGDTNADPTTYLTTTNDTFYQWRGLTSGTYFWKVRATTGTQNSTFSQTLTFRLDLCQPDTAFSSALSYPMSYNNVTDKITVWGSNGTDYTAMGSNTSNPITLEKIFEFGKAVRGICAVTKPAAGTYAVLTKLDIGNTSHSLNTTFVTTTGESIDFGKQVRVLFNATLTAGNLTAAGSPFSGTTLSFSGTDANATNEGQLFLLNGSKLELFDSSVLHKSPSNDTNPFRLFWGGNVTAKRSTLQNWFTIRFLAENNTLEDMVITNLGEGFFPDITQVGKLDTIKSRNVKTGGLVLSFNTTNVTGPNATITALEVSEVRDDILVINYTGTTKLINAILNFSNINWTVGSFSGSIQRQYDYETTITDSVGAAIANTSIVMLDLRGDTLFDLLTDANGKIAKQTITRVIYDYNNKQGDERGPHTLKIKSYGKNFAKLAKEFSAATVETVQLEKNTFTKKTEVQAKNQTGIIFNPPRKVNYGDETNSTAQLSMKLNNFPVAQSEFFGIFANGTKLVETTNFTIDYATGDITFIQNMSGNTIRPVYSYGGNITLVNGVSNLTASNLYDFMQVNLSDVMSTVDGITFTLFVDLIIGNNTTTGSIIDSTVSFVFKDGYNFAFKGSGGYIDLSGVTAGGGTGGGLPLNIRNAVGTTFNPDDVVEVLSFVFDATGKAKSATVNVTTYFPNGTMFASKISTQVETGFYTTNVTLPSNAPTGTYDIKIDATAGSDEVHDTLVFQVKSNPSINLFASTPIKTSTSASIGALVTSSNGVATNCDGNFGITVLDLASGGVTASGNMVNLGTGLYNFTFTTPATEGSFYVNASCVISGTTYTGATLISTQTVSTTATAPAVASGGGGGVGGTYISSESGTIFAQVKDSQGSPANSATCSVTSYYPNDTIFINSQLMSYVSGSDGLYKFNFNAPSTKGVYLATINCTNPTSYGTSSFHISEWASKITEVQEIVSAQRKIVIEDPDSVDGGKNYTAIIYFYNASQQLEDPSNNLITIKLFDSLNDLNETKNATRVSKGIYNYSYKTFNTSTGGNWRTVANVTDLETSSFWFLSTGPFDVKIIQITDNVIPTITAEIMLNNTGDPKDVTVYYWIEYLNGTKIDTASETFFAQSGPQTIFRTLNAQEAGTYVFKVLVRWGVFRTLQEAASSLQFEAVSGNLNISLTKLISPDWLLPKTKENIIINTTVKNTGGTDISTVNVTDEVPFDFDAPSNNSVDIWFINSTHDIKLATGYTVNVSNIDADSNIEVFLNISNMSQTDVGGYLKSNEFIRMDYLMNSSEMVVNTSRIMDTNASVIDISSQTTNASVVKTLTSANAFVRAFKKIISNPVAPSNISVEILMKAMGGNITEISLSDYLPTGAEISNINVTYFNKTSGIYKQLFNVSDYLMTGPSSGILPDGFAVDIYFYNFSYNFTNWDGTLYEGENITVTYNATILGGGTWTLPAIVSGFDPQYKKFIKTETQSFARVPLFDVMLDVLTEKVSAGEIVKALFEVFNVGGPKAQVDVFLTHSVKTMQGNLVTESSKTLAVIEKKEEMLELKLPSNIKSGMYTFEALATYSGREAVATDVFEVTGIAISPNIVYIALALAGISIILFVMKAGTPKIKLKKIRYLIKKKK